jgi:hypothetical protein
MTAKSSNESEYLSPKEMQDWLLQEVRDSAKAFELRVKEATEIASAYAQGQLSPKEAHERCWHYQQRWGEALYGTTAGDNVSDKTILEAIDEARAPDFASRLVGEDMATLFRKGRRGNQSR